ncbi:Cse1-domain-containing protein [Dipodascopsis tothii]|uniref:Cse1-domain-containing protein n=1 Tax=Dipodascopsis tothii TaxID=44089 RepID=UPI0034CEB8C7
MASQDLQALAGLLQSSLDPAQAKQAEQALRAAETQPGFAILLLQTVVAAQLPHTTRLSAALLFKNFIRRKWTDEDGNHRLPAADVAAVKREIVGLMITQPPALQVQLGESISIMADSDFPDRWQDLIDDLVSRLSPTDMALNNGVLQVAHSIFKRWRPLFQSDALYLEIKLVLGKFCGPFLDLFKQTDRLVAEHAGDKATLETLFQTLLLLTKIYFDLNCQDIPEFFEDNMTELMGLVHKYLVYTSPLLETDDDDETGPAEKVKASICELIQLYSQRYADVFEPLMQNFIETTWTLLTTTGVAPKYDVLVSKALAFLTTSIGKRSEMFSAEDTLQQIVEKVVLPNVALRPSDEELFEDDPIEYIRRDLEGSDSETRRRAATDFLQELKERHEGAVTGVVMKYVQHYLAQYEQNKAHNWRAKDTAVYLFSAIAIKGLLTASGVSSTNLLLDVVAFFTQNIAPDLVAADAHPILKVDAIKYIHIFRNQLTKQQLGQAFPVLSSMFVSPEYVVYTYAAITIERILSIRQQTNSSHFMFDKEDIAPVAQELLENLFVLIEKGQTPEKLAENEFLMKCVMRVLVTGKETVVPFADSVMQHLLHLLTETAKNPSNPRFSHYMFESLGAVIRFAAPTRPAGAYDAQLFPLFLSILGQDVAEFIPYVFQLLAQLLELTEAPVDGAVAESYKQLVRPLLSPQLWESRGNIPALARLLQALLARNAQAYFVDQGLVEPLLGVFQKLIASKVNDGHGLDLLEAILLHVPLASVERYVRQIAIFILQRLQSSRTEKLVQRFGRFVYFLAAVKKLGPDFAVSFVDQAQDGIFGDVFGQFILPSTTKYHAQMDKKIAVVGLTAILFESAKFQGQYAQYWVQGATVLTTMAQTDTISNYIDILKENDEVEGMVGAMPLRRTLVPGGGLDDDDVTFGASFVKLTTTTTKPIDVRPDVTDNRAFVEAALKAYGSTAQPLLAQLPSDTKAIIAKSYGITV